jgi:hypothetical protein
MVRVDLTQISFGEEMPRQLPFHPQNLLPGYNRCCGCKRELCMVHSRNEFVIWWESIFKGKMF